MKLIIEGITYIYDVISVEEEINEIYNHNIRNSSREIEIDCSNDFSYFKNLYDRIWTPDAKTLYKKDYVIQGHFLDTRNDNIFKIINMTLISISVNENGNNNKYSAVLNFDVIELIGLNKDLKFFSKNYLKSAKAINKFNL